MKQITFGRAGKLAGLANMLEIWGINVEDHEIARDMNAPALFLHEDDAYLAGVMLYRPKWLNLYLHPRGYHMEEIQICRDDVGAFLRTQRTAMLAIQSAPNRTRFIVFTGYNKGRYEFINLKSPSESAPDRLSFSAAMLKRRLSDNALLFTLAPCEPVAVDFAPLLLDSMRNLNKLEVKLLEVCMMTVSQPELRAMHEPLFRALIVEVLPLALLNHDLDLAEELMYLQHDYRHVFTQCSPERVPLYEKLPRSSIKDCILWLKEDIADKLYALGVDEEQILPLLRKTKTSRQ